MAEFFDTLDTWERELQEKAEFDQVEEIDPETIIEVDEEPAESVEVIDPSDDGLFQMLSASVRPAPITSPKKRTTGHHHHHHHHHHNKLNSPQRKSMKPRPPPSSESPTPTVHSEGVVATPKTEARKGRPTSGSRTTSSSRGRQRTSEKDDLSTSQKSAGSGSVSRNQKATISSGRSKSQPRERGAGSRHHHTHRRERNKVTEGERHRSASLGRKTRRQSDQSQNQLSRSCKSTSTTASSLSSTVHDDTSPKHEITETQIEPPNVADDPLSPNDDIDDNKEEPVPPSSSKGVVAMLSLGFVSAARTTRKEAEKVVKGAAKVVTHPKEAVRSVGEAASAVTAGVMNATKTTNTEASSSEVNQQEELRNRDKAVSSQASGAPSVDSKSDSVHHRSRHESIHSPKGTHKHHRERSRTGSGDLSSPQKTDGLKTRSEHLDRNESKHGSKPRMTVRERRHQAAQQRNANKPESQQPKTPTETRSRAITSPSGNTLPQRNVIDRKQSGQSQGSDSKFSDSSRKNDDQPNENDDDWLKARLSKQDDIMTFAKKKDTTERKPLSWNGREQETMAAMSRSPRGLKGEIKLESSHDRNHELEQDHERKTILTAGAKVAKVAIGVTALGAREAINAITNPKKEIEKVVRKTNKAAMKTARAASNPKETVQKMATLTQKISLGVVREATEVTKGTLQLGKETVQGTVGYVSGLLKEDDDVKDDPRFKEKVEYDSQKLESRQVNASLVDRITRVVETSDEKGNGSSPLPPRSQEQRRQRAQNSPRPGMPNKMPSRLVVDATGKPNSSWET